MKDIFEIPVYPHVQKWVYKTYSSKDKIVLAEEYTVLGKLVSSCLLDSRKPKGSYNDQVKDRLTGSIVIKLTVEQSRMSPRLFKLYKLNTELDKAFKEDLLLAIRILDDHNVPAYAACKTFLQHFAIDDSEYSLDAAYKYWQRSPLKPKKQALVQSQVEFRTTSRQ